MVFLCYVPTKTAAPFFGVYKFFIYLRITN